MADKRPIGFAETSTVAGDDYLLIDGQTNGTRKVKPGVIGKTKTSELTNDAGFQTASEVSAAISANVDNTLAVSGKAADAKKTGDEITLVKQDINEKAWDIGSYNRFNKNDVTQGYISKTGTITSNADWRVSDYIPVSEGEELYASGNSTSSFALYDNNKSIVSNSNNWSNPFTVPQGVAFIRMSYLVGSLSSAYMSIKNEYDAYTPITPYMHKKFDEINARKYHFENVSAMVAALNLIAGDLAYTAGYYTRYDSGGNEYFIASTAARVGSVELANGLYAVPIGAMLSTRQLGLRSGDNGQSLLNAYIADTSYNGLYISDLIKCQKTEVGTPGSPVTDVDVIELIQVRRNNFKIVFENYGSLKMDTVHEDYYRILAIANASNIIIVDPVIEGDSDVIEIEEGEYGHGLYLRNCQNVDVYNGRIGKCFGDAVDVGGGSANIRFHGSLDCRDCGRQGMSIIDANGIYIDTITGRNIRRTEPGAVVDFEPNTSTESIIATVNTIRNINCNKGLSVAGKGNKIVNVQNLICQHDNSNYSCDIEVYGALPFSENPKTDVTCENVVVWNSSKNCVRLIHLHSKANITIKKILIDGAAKQNVRDITEATVFMQQLSGSEIRNLNLDICVTNNTSIVGTYGLFLYSNSSTVCKFVDCNINYTDDSNVYVTSVLPYADLERTAIKTQRQANGIYNLLSEYEAYDIYDQTTFMASAKSSTLIVSNYTTNYFELSKIYLYDYIVNQESYIEEQENSWKVNSKGVYVIEFDHTNKEISIVKM